MSRSLILLNTKSQASLNHGNLDGLYNPTMSIGERIKKLRKQNDLSGDKFGELCGVSKGMVSQWESDIVTPPVDRLLLLQKSLEFSIDWIYTGKISIADEISQRLGVKERQAWYRVGNSLVEPDEGTNGKQ